MAPCLNHLRIASLAFVLTASYCQPSHASSNFSDQKAAPATGTIALGSAHPLPPGFLGANIDGAYNPSGTYQWTDSKTISAIKALSLQSLRFPGGTDANYWDWQTGWVYSAFPTGAGPFKETLAKFVPLAKLTGPTIFDLNVMTYNNTIAAPSQQSEMVKNQIAMLHEAERSGIPVNFIELGNEFYLGINPNNPDANYLRRFPTGTAYANEMNDWIMDLKAAFPKSEIAVVGQAYQCGTWNPEVLSTISGADAMTLHLYQRVTTSEDPVSILSKAFTQWARFDANNIQPLAAKKMSAWITEFDFVDHTSDVSYASTWLHGLYDAEMLIQFLSEPAVTQVDIYNVHSQSKRSSLIYDGTEKFGPHGAVKTEAGALSAAGQVMSIFGQALNKASSVAPISVSGLAPISPAPAETRFTPFPPVTGAAITYGATKSKALVLVNLSAQPVTLSYGSGTAQIQSISAPSLSTNIVTATSLTSAKRKISLRQFNIPAYSMNYLLF